MRLSTRIAKAESGLDEAILWREAQRLAAEMGERPEQIYAEAREILQKYEHLEIRLPGGRLDMESMLRGIAEGEGLDYDALVEETKRTLANMQRRTKRRRDRGRQEATCLVRPV